MFYALGFVAEAMVVVFVPDGEVDSRNDSFSEEVCSALSRPEAGHQSQGERGAHR